MGYYSSGLGMPDHDSGFARAQAQYDAMEPPEPKFTAETRFLRAVVWLRYDPTGEEVDEDDTIEGQQTPHEAEQDITRALGGGSRPFGLAVTLGLAYRPDSMEVVNAEYMTEEESDEYNPEGDAYARGFASAGRIYGGKG